MAVEKKNNNNDDNVSTLMCVCVCNSTHIRLRRLGPEIVAAVANITDGCWTHVAALKQFSQIIMYTYIHAHHHHHTTTM